MVDTRIRKNEKCVIGLPVCDYVFSSTRSCFIAYGFSTSSLERDILKSILEERGIAPVEAGDRLEPARFSFCTKICSKIIIAQFCIVLANHDVVRGREMPNANVNMEYGLMLGHNKYIIPFQKDSQTLPFNVSSLDTVKYNQINFKTLAISAIDKAIAETAQTQPTSNVDQILSVFTLIKNAAFVNVEHSTDERALFELGRTFGFNFLVKFDGLSYVFLGNFTTLSGNAVIWRLTKFLALIEARLKMVPISNRNGFGFSTSQGDTGYYHATIGNLAHSQWNRRGE